MSATAKRATLPQVIDSLSSSETLRLVRVFNRLNDSDRSYMRDALWIEWHGEFARPFDGDRDVVRLCSELERLGLPAISDRLLRRALTQITHTSAHLKLLAIEDQSQ